MRGKVNTVGETRMRAKGIGGEKRGVLKAGGSSKVLYEARGGRHLGRVGRLERQLEARGNTGILWEGREEGGRVFIGRQRMGEEKVGEKLGRWVEIVW